MKLLNEILGTKYPIIQGGMANIATGEFAAACSNAGALGLIGSGVGLVLGLLFVKHINGIADLLGLQHRVAELFGVEFHGGGNCQRLVAEVGTGLQQRKGDRAVNHPGIEVAVAVVVREPLAQRALAGCGGSVDGDDHEKSAPRPRIIGMKSGKLVAIKPVSSIFTGASDAVPITSADMAMR